MKNSFFKLTKEFFKYSFDNPGLFAKGLMASFRDGWNWLLYGGSAVTIIENISLGTVTAGFVLLFTVIRSSIKIWRDVQDEKRERLAFEAEQTRIYETYRLNIIKEQEIHEIKKKLLKEKGEEDDK